MISELQKNLDKQWQEHVDKIDAEIAEIKVKLNELDRIMDEIFKNAMKKANRQIEIEDKIEELRIKNDLEEAKIRIKNDLETIV